MVVVGELEVYKKDNFPVITKGLPILHREDNTYALGVWHRIKKKKKYGEKLA